MAKNTEQFERPILTVDVVIFTLIDDRLHVLLPKRIAEPFLDRPCLVGVYIRTQEDFDTYAAARRAVIDKTGILNPPFLEQLAMFSGRKRDPRGWSATMAYICMVKTEEVPPELLNDFHSVDRLPSHIGFDHRKIVHWAVQRVRSKASYSSLPLCLLPSKFTLHALYKTYEAIMGTMIDYGTFRRKITDKDLDLIEATEEMSDPKVTMTKAATLYRAVGKKMRFFEETF